MRLKVRRRTKCCVLQKKPLGVDAKVGAVRQRSRAMVVYIWSPICSAMFGCVRSSPYYNGGSHVCGAMLLANAIARRRVRVGVRSHWVANGGALLFGPAFANCQTPCNGGFVGCAVFLGNAIADCQTPCNGGLMVAGRGAVFLGKSICRFQIRVLVGSWWQRLADGGAVLLGKAIADCQWECEEKEEISMEKQREGRDLNRKVRESRD